MLSDIGAGSLQEVLSYVKLALETGTQGSTEFVQTFGRP